MNRREIILETDFQSKSSDEQNEQRRSETIGNLIFATIVGVPLAATAVAGIYFTILDPKVNDTMTLEEIEQHRIDATPLDRFEMDYLDGGDYNPTNSNFTEFGQSCLADTPYDTSPYGWRADDASNGRTQAGIKIDPESPNVVTVVSSLPGMPVLVFDGLLDDSTALQPANRETVSQLEGYGCEVEEQR